MSYQSQNIFSDPKLNAICDLILKQLFDTFPATELLDPNYVYVSFILSGKAAAIVQGETSSAVKNIVFQTSNIDFYNFCQSTLPTILFNCKMIAFKENILLYPLDYFFEIWLSDTIEPILVNNIYVQQLLSIPEESL